MADRAQQRAVQTDGMGDGMHTFGVLRVVWRAERGFRQRGVQHRHPIRTASLPAAPCTVVRAVLLTTVRSKSTFLADGMHTSAAPPQPSGVPNAFSGSGTLAFGT